MVVLPSKSSIICYLEILDFLFIIRVTFSLPESLLAVSSMSTGKATLMLAKLEKVLRAVWDVESKVDNKL